MTVLIAYASVHDSTASIARRIGAVLAEHGERTDVRPIDELEDREPHGGLDGYDAVVLGSAVHDMAWLPSAAGFVSRHRETLARRPLWLFSVGMPAALRGPWRRLAPREEKEVTEPLLRLVAPEGHRLFSGVIRPEHLSQPGRLMFRALGLRYGDYRDWDDVRRWADEMARNLASHRRRAPCAGLPEGRAPDGVGGGPLRVTRKAPEPEPGAGTVRSPRPRGHGRRPSGDPREGRREW